jgi:trehalose 6-phosphate synthase/phosphatase
MGKTIIVSNRLPVKIQRKDDMLVFTPSEGGIATGLGSIYKEGNNLWVGWPGMFINDEEERDFVITELQKESMFPVFLTKNEIRAYYEGFSNATLWPTFHYFNEYVVYNKSYWEAYQKANAKFCEVIGMVAKPGDTIWVHDYQLLLLPGMLRKKIEHCLIGFFQHIPFPSFEVFRMLPWRKSLLDGMLGADLIGFHTYDDMRHFLNSVNRIVGTSDTNGQLEIDNRYVLVDAFPMGIDYKKYSKNVLTEEVQQKEKIFRESLGKQKLVLSIDRLDYSKGIPQKLTAFERLLEKRPSLQGNISLVMIVVPSRDHVPRYKELKEEIDEIVGRINSSLSTLEWRPIYYFYRSFPLDHLSALYHMADIALITPMRDGMNLVAKEYVASKADKKGVLILSEMAGASKELSDAILINPNDNEAIVAALEEAIDMSEEDQLRLMKSMQNVVRLYDIHNWVELFLDRLNYISEKQKSFSSLPVDEIIIREMMQKYHHAKSRLIFLDLDESMLISDNFPFPSQLDRNIHKMLKTIIASNKNKVVCISGADTKTMEIWFDGLQVDLVAEHGMWTRKWGQPWQTFDDISNEWKYDIFPALEHFVKRTPGSFIEEKDFSLVWHYRKAETGLGAMRNRELTEHLKFLVSNMDLNVVEENMVVEIKSSLINKGRAVKRWLEEHNAQFVFALGGNNSSEDFMKILPSNAYSIKIGRSHTTHAKYMLLKKELIREIFQMMALTKEYNLN